MIYKYNVEITKRKIPKLVKEESYDLSEETAMVNPRVVYDTVCRYLRLDRQAEERVMMLALDPAAQIIGIFEISHGTVSCSPVSTREVFLRLLVCGASCFILVHNHPSGSVKPSICDQEVAICLKQAADIMSLKLLDFMIVSDKGYYSFNEKKIL